MIMTAKLKKQTGVADSGALQHNFEFTDDAHDIDNIEIDIDVGDGDDQLIRCVAYSDSDVVYRNAFKPRDIQFDPISILGRGESSSLLGVSPNEVGYTGQGGGDDADPICGNDIPRDVQIAFNSIGLSVVPQGTWWLDGY